MNIAQFGKVALVTGASSGIGAAFARRLAKEGLSLVLVARREEHLNALAAELLARYSTRENFKVHVCALDLTAVNAATLLLDFLNERSVQVDLLVNNAGFGFLGAVDEIEVGKLTSTVDLNCRAVTELTRVLLPAMKQRKRGGIIIISSVVGAIPVPWFSVYAASKAFDLYFGEALSAECRGSGVTVLTVLPGLTSTEFQAASGKRDYHSPMRTAEQVVDTALNAFGRKSIVVDGWLNKLLVHGTRFLPRSLALYLSTIVMKKELGR